MTQATLKSLDDLVKHVGRYPEGAYVFVREGLGHATERIHGPESDAHRALQEYLAAHHMEWGELAAQWESSSLPESLASAIEKAGGWERVNRHITGRQLCWELRNFALDRWGLLARTVLEGWNIRSTTDFGRIVFGFIDFELMQKQPGDSIADFEDIFSFDEVFDVAYRAILHDPPDPDGP